MIGESSVSIILCTRNRAASLQRTLAVLAPLRVPAGWSAEIILVDNGSTDQTADLAMRLLQSGMPVHSVYEPRRGKASALNAGIARARGDILAFTDDDIRVPEDWIERILAAVGRDGADAAVGPIRLAPELNRPWMSDRQKGWLAGIDLQQDGPAELVGANMAFRRSVLQRVPAFDPELGPGVLGYGEDTLFGRQLHEAGFQVRFAPNMPVTHDFDASRLQRRHWLDTARRLGQTRAYLNYHWDHADIRFPRLVGWWLATKLHVRRRLQPPPPPESEGCPEWEMSYVFRLERCRQFAQESRRPRNYARHGLTKVGR